MRSTTTTTTGTRERDFSVGNYYFQYINLLLATPLILSLGYYHEFSVHKYWWACV